MLIIVAFLIILAMLSTKVSNRFGLPLLLGFILIGVLVGSDVLNLIYFDNSTLAKQIADILLIFIIFDGGFRVHKDAFRQVAGPALTLATLGVALTAGILGLLVHWLFKVDLVYALLLASIISSTDAAGVFMVTKANPIRPRLANTLNVESAANDPMAILLTITFIQIITAESASLWLLLLGLVWQFLGGVLVGLGAYQVARFFFRWLQSDNRGNYHILMVGAVLLCYALADLVGANGIIAVFFMGYGLGNSNYPAKRSISSFLETISTIFNIVLFILLGLLAFPSRFILIWKEALVIVGVLMFVARPLAVWISTLPFRFPWKEKVFLMWGGIKGAVPIVLATYPLSMGLDQDGFIFDTIFFVVFLSCFLQGTTLGVLARILGLGAPARPPTPHVVELHSLNDSPYDMFEILVVPGAYASRKTLAELQLGRDVLVSSIIREGQLVLPKGSTVVQEHDILFIMADGSKIDIISACINARPMEA